MKVYPSPSPMFSVRVKVPATTANLGAGYDVLGLALGYYNEVEISAWNDPLMPPVAIQVDGEGADELPLDRGNLIYKAVRAAIDRIGRSVPAVRIKAVNRIPLARGLGSSSAAIVAGLLGVNAGFGGKLSLDELIDLAVKLEGHPDNVVPALAGGLCVAAQDGAKTHYLSWTGKSLFRGMRAVVAVPYFKLSTHEAREVLPKQVSRADAVFNSSRTALCLGAFLGRRHEMLADAMEDRLHQPYRKDLVPGFEDVVASARKAGAWGAALSGAGPSVLAICPPKSAERVGEAMAAAFRRRDVAALWMDLEPGVSGARASTLRVPSPPARVHAASR